MPDSDSVTYFTRSDWVVLGGYFLLLLGTGYWFNRRPQSGTDDYFLAGRRMPMWPVALSVVATSLSAATFIGGPEQSFSGNLTYLSASIGTILAAILVARFFIPHFYHLKVSTLYELMEVRFGPFARLLTSCMFLLGRVMASGARIYIASLAAALILFQEIRPQHLLVSIVVLTGVGILYTLVGGIASVIWTDVIQTFVFVLAAVAALVVLFWRIPIGFSDIVATLSSSTYEGGSKLTMIDTGINFSKPFWGFDVSAPYTLLTAIFGFTLFNLAAYGTDQDLTQRMLTCKDARSGSRSMITAAILGLPITALFMAVGLLLFIFYKRPDLMQSGAPQYTINSREVFLEFVTREMPSGVTGLMVAGLFSAGLSSINSALNAMASSFVGDIYRPMRMNQTEQHYLLVGRIAVVGSGIAVCYGGIVCVIMHESSEERLINFALGVMTLAYAGLLAVFATAIFTRRGSENSVAAALFTGFAVILLLQPKLWGQWFGANLPWAEAIDIAFPWRMAIATSLAFVVCCLGRSDRARIAGSGGE